MVFCFMIIDVWLQFRGTKILIYAVIAQTITVFFSILTVLLQFTYRGMLLLSPGDDVLDVHVVLLHMYMSYRSTCTCRTALHVHLKHHSPTTFGTLGYNKLTDVLTVRQTTQPFVYKRSAEVTINVNYRELSRKMRCYIL